MENNEYNAAEAIEIGKAEEVIRGPKELYALENAGDPPFDRIHVE